MNGPLTGRGVLFWLIGFFGLIFATNGYFITMAVKSFSGEDEQKPYLQGIAYNDTLARRAEQRKLGWQATMSAARLPTGAVRIAVNLVQSDGSPEVTASLSGELRHPANEHLDRPLALKEIQPGHYQMDLTNVRPGFWDVMVANANDAKPFEAVRRVWVP